MRSKMTSDGESTHDAPFVYLKNNVDYTGYALDFFEDEVAYFSYIKSYTTEEDVILFIRENGIVTKCAKLDMYGDLHEAESGDDFENIIEWVTAYKGEVASIDFILDNVYIGEDLVPLWKVLADAKEEDDIDEMAVAHEEAAPLISKCEEKIMIALLIWYMFLFSLLLLVICTA